MDVNANVETVLDAPRGAQGEEVPEKPQRYPMKMGIRRWLRENDLNVSREDTRAITHVLMQGGRYAIPPHLEEEFHERLATSHEAGVVTSFVETRSTPTFRLYMDLDMKSTEYMARETLLLIVLRINVVIKQLFPEADDAVTVLIAEPKELTEKNTVLIKTGLHLVWKALWVADSEVLYVRHAVVTDLTAHFGNTMCCNEWDDIVDSAVYRPAQGLRMVFQHKFSICTACRNSSKREDCSVCMHSGKIDGGRPYLLLSTVQGGTVQKATDSLAAHDIIKDTSIRAPPPPGTTVTAPKRLEHLALYKAPQPKAGLQRKGHNATPVRESV